MFYLGLEARQKENTYNDYMEAEKDAKYVANRLNLPIRLFELMPNKKSRLVSIVSPNSDSRPLGKRVFREED